MFAKIYVKATKKFYIVPVTDVPESEKLPEGKQDAETRKKVFRYQRENSSVGCQVLLIQGL